MRLAVTSSCGIRTVTLDRRDGTTTSATLELPPSEAPRTEDVAAKVRDRVGDEPLREVLAVNWTSAAALLRGVLGPAWAPRA